jgi:zinc transport system substrate-binding protein
VTETLFETQQDEDELQIGSQQKDTEGDDVERHGSRWYAFEGHTDEGHTDEGHTDEGHTDEGHTDEGHTDESS